MGTHISRVKSVDLDAWTDEQLQSVLKWGNGRANKYVYIHQLYGIHTYIMQILGSETPTRPRSLRSVCDFNRQPKSVVCMTDSAHL